MTAAGEGFAALTPAAHGASSGSATTAAQPVRPAVLRRPSDIRAFAADDASAVAQLFQNTFRKRDVAAPQMLRSYLIDLFLHHPWYDPALASRVCVDADGSVRGFIGILPVRMSFRGRRVLAAAAGSLMVENPQQDPLAGARLLRAYFNGPQELSFSETSNPLSQNMWDKLGGETVAAYSMEWLRPFRPAGFGLTLAADRWPSARLLRPVAVLADRAFDAVSGSMLAQRNPKAGPTRSIDVDPAAFSDLVMTLSQRTALRPDWSRESLLWQLQHAARKERYGDFVCTAVLGKNDRLLGCYAYHAKPHGIAVTLQVLAQPGATGAVLDRLFADVAARGCVAVRGRTQPELLHALLLRRCVMLHRSSLTVRSANPELLAAIRTGNALMVGLAGEAWTRLIGGVMD